MHFFKKCKAVLPWLRGLVGWSIVLRTKRLQVPSPVRVMYWRQLIDVSPLHECVCVCVCVSPSLSPLLSLFLPLFQINKHIFGG